MFRHDKAHVVRFPESASGRSHVVGFDIADYAGARDRTSAAKRTNRAPFQGFEDRVVVVSGLRNLRELL